MRTLLGAIGRIGIIIAVLIAFFFGLVGTVYLSLRSPEVQVPDLRGQNRYGARQTLENMGLRMRERSTRFDPEARPDTVLDQLPRAGETVKGGQTVFVTVSTAQPREGERASQPTENTNANRETNASSNANDNRNDNRRTANRNANNRNANNRNANNSNANSNENANRNANGNSNRNANANNRNANGNANNRNANASNRNANNRNANGNANSRPANNNNGNRNRRPPPTFTTPPFVPGE